MASSKRFGGLIAPVINPLTADGKVNLPIIGMSMSRIVPVWHVFFAVECVAVHVASVLQVGVVGIQPSRFVLFL